MNLNNIKYAPIVIFCFLRLEHLKKLIDSLKKNSIASQSHLIFYSDAARNENEKFQVDRLREYLETVDGFKEIELVYRDKNFGLAESIINGVTREVDRFGRVIVLEDDLIVSPYFLEYMNEMLTMYELDEQVVSIHGYVYPSLNLPSQPFFITGADCWGWGTWKRAWDIFESDGYKLQKAIIDNKLKKKFNFDFSYPYSKMLQDQINGKNNSWAIRWNASAFVNNMFTLYPPSSFVMNVGFDNTGENCKTSEDYKVKLIQDYKGFTKVRIVESEKGYNSFKRYFIKINGGYIKYYLKRIINLWI